MFVKSIVLWANCEINTYCSYPVITSSALVIYLTTHLGTNPGWIYFRKLCKQDLCFLFMPGRGTYLKLSHIV